MFFDWKEDFSSQAFFILVQMRFLLSLPPKSKFQIPILQNLFFNMISSKFINGKMSQFSKIFIDQANPQFTHFYLSYFFLHGIEVPMEKSRLFDQVRLLESKKVTEKDMEFLLDLLSQGQIQNTFKIGEYWLTLILGILYRALDQTLSSEQFKMSLLELSFFHLKNNQYEQKNLKILLTKTIFKVTSSANKAFMDRLMNYNSREHFSLEEILNEDKFIAKFEPFYDYLIGQERTMIFDYLIGKYLKCSNLR